MNPATNPPSILIGVCGGIAAYKTVELVSRLRQQGHPIQVLMTQAATQFVTPTTFSGVSGQPTHTALFADPSTTVGDGLYPHLYPATATDLFLIAPATAHTIACLAHGEGSDLLTTAALSLPAACIRIFCPAMNVEMWEQSVVQENVRKLEARGWIRIGPEAGMLACGMEGYGRMTEPAAILTRVNELLAQRQRLAGRHVLILSGPTHEFLDPVRFIGNASSGRMGQALAEQAADRGAKVTFITGPVPADHLPRRASIDLIPVTSATDLLNAARKPFTDADAIIFAAAIADYQPATRSKEKSAKSGGDWNLTLTPTPDVAATLGATKKPGQTCVGFALQTGDGRDEARAKLVRKHFDAIILNHPDSIGAEDGHFTCITADAEKRWGRLSKSHCAAQVLDLIPS